MTSSPPCIDRTGWASLEWPFYQNIDSRPFACRQLSTLKYTVIFHKYRGWSSLTNKEYLDQFSPLLSAEAHVHVLHVSKIYLFNYDNNILIMLLLQFSLYRKALTLMVYYVCRASRQQLRYAPVVPDAFTEKFFGSYVVYNLLWSRVFGCITTN
jgi:hypothetical protein